MADTGDKPPFDVRDGAGPDEGPEEGPDNVPGQPGGPDEGFRLDRNDALDFEPLTVERPQKSGGGKTMIWLGLGLVVALAIGGAAAWVMLGGMPQEDAPAAKVPLVTATIDDIKKRPETPGGMDVPDRDKLVYDRVGGEEEPRVERLLPGPEEPRPAPEAAPPAPEPQRVRGADEPPLPNAQPRAPVSASELSDPQPFTAPPPPAPTAEQIAEAAPPPPVVVPSAPPVNPASDAAVGTPAAPPAPAPVAPTAEPPRGASPSDALVAAAETQSTALQPGSAAPTPEPASTVVQPALGGAYAIQVAAVRSQDAGEKEWNRLKKANPDLFSALELSVVRADLGERGIFYRLRAGPLASRADAKALCGELKTRKLNCLVVKR
ncbi:MAG: SPOR domain-containing protein [Magnetovibrionaceae bacterium]